MPEFPSATALLEMLVECESYTPQGERRIAEMIADFAERWQLGVVRTHEYPADIGYTNTDPSPLNVTIDINKNGEEKPGEMLVHSHYDTINPYENYPDGFQGHPCQLTQAADQDIVSGLGSADPKAGVVSMLLAARTLNQKLRSVRHSTRFLFVGDEERKSRGTFAALYHSNNLAQGTNCIVSMDVGVGTKIDDPPFVGIGRPGRIGLEVKVRGVGTHAGNAQNINYKRLASVRESLILLAIPDLQFPQRTEAHYKKFMPNTAAVARRWGPKRNCNMTVPTESTIELDVINGNPALTALDIRAAIYRQLQIVLQTHGAWEEGILSVGTESDRETPFILPYLDKESHPWVTTVARHVTEESDDTVLTMGAGRGTADEGALVHSLHAPCCILAPVCEGEHGPGEQVRLSSIERNARVLHRLAVSQWELPPRKQPMGRKCTS